MGGKAHTARSYGAVDAWVEQQLAAAAVAGGTEADASMAASATTPASSATATTDEAEDGADRGTRTDDRFTIATLYELPSLFQSCDLRVPKFMRPGSTDGVFLCGSRRSGTYPHIDPTSTSAWVSYDSDGAPQLRGCTIRPSRQHATTLTAAMP